MISQQLIIRANKAVIDKVKSELREYAKLHNALSGVEY